MITLKKCALWHIYIMLIDNNMIKNIIVAASSNNAIGNKGKPLFHLHEDMKFFKKMTMGNVIIMGRKTYESIGGILDNRVNLVVSHFGKYKSIEDAVKFAEKEHPDKEIFFIGGEQIYKEVIEKDYVDNIYLTMVHKNIEEADAWFPSLDLQDKWHVVRSNKYYDEKEGVHFDIMEITKKK